MDKCFSPSPLTSAGTVWKSPGNAQNLEEGQEHQTENFLALKVSLPFRLSTFYPILTWEIHTTEHCRSICKLSLWTLFLTSKCRNSFHTWWTWVLHWGCAGWGMEVAVDWAHCWSSQGGNSIIWKSLGIFLPLGWGCYKSMERNCPGYKSALSLQCCRGHFPMSRRGLFLGSERQQEELRLHSFGGEGAPLLQYSWPRTRLCPQPWAHGAAAAAAGQCQPSSLQCSVSSNLRKSHQCSEMCWKSQRVGATKPKQRHSEGAVC